jgi:SAM-dependent methyltransferase
MSPSRHHVVMAGGRRASWDAEAATFDDAPDHGLGQHEVREAWKALLLPLLPPPPARVADLGCGTGSLSVLLAGEGYDVVGIDFAAQMLEKAHAKATAAGLRIALAQADAERPPFRVASFDAVIGRHILWSLSDADGALRRWVRLLHPQAVVVVIEGRWSTGAGLGADELERLLRRHRTHVDLMILDDPALWGQPINDERYLLVSHS